MTKCLTIVRPRPKAKYNKLHAPAVRDAQKPPCCNTKFLMSDNDQEKKIRMTSASGVDDGCVVRCEAGCSNGQPPCQRSLRTPCEPAMPSYDVFLGGSCGNTVWRRQLVIPFLKKRAISYYDPQRSVWSENMIYEESIAKENSSLFLFVLDPATVNATSFLEIAYFAARKAPKLVVVFLGRTEWKGKAHPEDLPDRVKTCQLLDRILAAHQVPLLHSIEEALNYIEEEVIGSKTWREALATPQQRLPYIGLKTKKAAQAAGNSAKAAWGRFRSAASRLALTGVADTMAFVGTHLVLPSLPVGVILLMIFLVNVVFFSLHTLWLKARAKRPRGIVDMTRTPLPRNPSIPVPRMNTIATPLIAKQPNREAVRQSKKWVESLGLSELGAVPRGMENAWRRVPSPSTDPLTSMIDAEAPKSIKKSPSEPSTHVFLGCSSLDELDWVNKEAAPFLQRHEVAYSTVLACDSVPPESRMILLKKGSRAFRQVLYHIPSTKTFLSGMVEIAYLLGHSDWQVTLCVSKEAELLEAQNDKEDEIERAARRRRNDCYAIAFCYLKDMAKRHQCRVFSEIDEALGHCVKLAQTGGC